MGERDRELDAAIRAADEWWRRINEAVSWDARKELADIYQDAGGILDETTGIPYPALLAVARWGAARVLAQDEP